MQINSIETDFDVVSHMTVSHDSRGVSSSHWRFLLTVIRTFHQTCDSSVLSKKKGFEFNLTVSELEVKQRKVQNDNAQVWPAYPLLD